MKNLLLISAKKKLIVGGVIVTLAGGGITAALNQPQTTGADTSPLVQQVQHNTDELANHEARITNTENDVKDLQNNTGTAPSTTRVSVPEVSTPPATAPLTSTTTDTVATTAPAPITVANSSYNVGGSRNGYCTLTYTDGSADYVTATLTTVQNGNQGSIQDNCQSFVGQTKS